MNLRYMRYELLRLTRNRAFFFFTLVFPLMLFLIFGGTQANQTIQFGPTKIKFVLYYMVGMAGYGALMAALSGGARIASERQVGWNRQLRLTPLGSFGYMFAKAVTAYLMAMLSIAIMLLAGTAFGARLHGADRWSLMIGLILVGVLPFIALGIALGQLLPGDSMGPVLGGAGALLAFLGGIWFPLKSGSVLEHIGQFVPSYWISQASRVGIGGDAWTLRGWLVVAAWSLVCVALAGWSYRRDIAR